VCLRLPIGGRTTSFLTAEAPHAAQGPANTVINGVLMDHDWTSASGTYYVNANCTGTMVVVTPNSRVPLSLGLVIVKDGKEVRTVLDANAVSGKFTKVD
jgi:hypothetical protein